MQKSDFWDILYVHCDPLNQDSVVFASRTFLSSFAFITVVTVVFIPNWTSKIFILCYIRKETYWFLYPIVYCSCRFEFVATNLSWSNLYIPESKRYLVHIRSEFRYCFERMDFDIAIITVVGSATQLGKIQLPNVTDKKLQLLSSALRAYRELKNIKIIDNTLNLT